MKYSIPIVLMLFLFAACSKQEQKKSHTAQRELFRQSLVAIENYKSKILKSENVAELDSLFLSFEEELGEINMKFPAKTDFDLAENENDTLSSRILEIIQIRDSIRHSFAKPEIPQDSTMVAEDSHSAI